MSFLSICVLSHAHSSTWEYDNQPQRDDYELRVLSAIFDVIGDDRDVAEIKRGVNLVHEIKRRWLVIVVN